MYFDRRLWQLTRGLRGWIALAILLGLVASVVGIARFAILGVLISLVRARSVYLITMLLAAYIGVTAIKIARRRHIILSSRCRRPGAAPS